MELAGRPLRTLASWTDTHVKHQTCAAAIGLLAASALVVLAFVID